MALGASVRDATLRAGGVSLRHRISTTIADALLSLPIYLVAVCTKTILSSERLVCESDARIRWAWFALKPASSKTFQSAL